jgi:hypothetical protein
LLRQARLKLDSLEEQAHQQALLSSEQLGLFSGQRPTRPTDFDNAESLVRLAELENLALRFGALEPDQMSPNEALQTLYALKLELSQSKQ